LHLLASDSLPSLLFREEAIVYGVLQNLSGTTIGKRSVLQRIVRRERRQ
jgi:hypothetical protein